ncbi:short-chain fatty acyl-CoA regulator family protein [Nocardia jiangxiensis]|uniref:Short-chain fatty acyl-CoA regulator family protein n=1 Tax=Nocardia jiangxiensis TaxID=282685 RepID=A0ABW6S5G1_9NOCA
MQKMYAGPRLRALRVQRGLSQSGLARALGISVSYVNQLEHDQRPLTVQVLLRLNTSFALDMCYFARDTDARLVADLHDVFAEDPEGAAISPAEIDDLVARMPIAARMLVGLHRRAHGALEQLERASEGTDSSATESPIARPYEDVRDYFYDRRNHVAELDAAAEELFGSNRLTLGGLDLQLTRILREQHDIAVVIRNYDPLKPGPKRRYDPKSRVLTLARRLSHGQRAFQLAAQLAFLTQTETMARLIDSAEGMPDLSRGVLRIGLANYFAGALVLPYTLFHANAEALRYDIELLAAKFEVGFETVCHRLSTLQRPEQRGVPFCFVRTDRAGNISKRQSATAFHFSQVGGSCPLWVVHEAFSAPGCIRTQIAQMPDGRTYLWLARTTDENTPGYLAPKRDFAVGLGCDLTYAEKIVYSHGLPINDPRTAVLIGAGCKVCDRRDCAQRAFPQIGAPVHVDDNQALTVPYGA